MPSIQDQQAQQAEAERVVAESMAAAARRFLGFVQRWVRSQFAISTLPVPASEASPPGSVTAAATDPFDPSTISLFTTGEARGWWAQGVDAAGVESSLGSAWRRGWQNSSDVTISRDTSRVYLQSVTDRLSRTALPLVPDASMDLIRETLSTASTSGWSMGQTAERIAVEFSWDSQRDYWASNLSSTDSAIDDLLDAVGPPGSPAREAFKASSTDYARLLEERNRSVARLDSDASQWATRAERIARTETTGAFNAGALAAAETEGWGVKIWVATGGPRTRDSHLAASGQCVPVDGTFSVGGAELMMPGDPGGPPEEIIQCRCTVVFEDSCESAAGTYGDALARVDEESDARGAG